MNIDFFTEAYQLTVGIAMSYFLKLRRYSFHDLLLFLITLVVLKRRKIGYPLIFVNVIYNLMMLLL